MLLLHFLWYMCHGGVSAHVHMKNESVAPWTIWNPLINISLLDGVWSGIKSDSKLEENCMQTSEKVNRAEVPLMGPDNMK